jgi:hypothetical protein
MCYLVSLAVLICGPYPNKKQLALQKAQKKSHLLSDGISIL